MNRSRKTTLKKLGNTVLAAAILLPALAFGGCKKPVETTVETEPVETTVADPTPSPTPNPKLTALKKAGELGMNADDLRGEYELFLKYVDAVAGNPSLHEYNGYAYRIFPVVADHLKPENEANFLDKLRKLEINNEDDLVLNGHYFAYPNIITIESGCAQKYGEGYLAYCAYNGLMQFVSWNISGEDASLCYLDDKLVDVKTLPQDMVNDDTNYVSFESTYEGAPERMCAEYFTYAPGDISAFGTEEFIVALDYILGKETVDDMLYSNDTDIQLLRLYRECGISDDDIVTGSAVFVNIMNDYTGSFASFDLCDPRDILIKVYIKKIGPDYKDDAKFCRILASMDNKLMNTARSEYRDFLSSLSKFSADQSKDMIATLTKGMDTDGMDISLTMVPTTLMLDGELKLVCTLKFTDKEGAISYKSFVMDYDFENDQIKDFKVHDQSEWIANDLRTSATGGDSDDEKAIIASHTNSNVEAHNSDAYGGELGYETLYERATTLQKKYGVYIWFADLTPDGLLYNESTRAYDRTKLGHALTSIENVFSMYPANFFDQLLFDGYSGIGICLYDGLYEYAFSSTVTINDKSFLALYVDIALEKVQGHLGELSVYEKYFDGEDPVACELICDIWGLVEEFITNRNFYISNPSVTEDTWMALNSKDFKYLNNENFTEREEQLDEYAPKVNMSYFLANGALCSSKHDRCLFYMYIMLSAMQGKQPAELTPECAAKAKELNRGIRESFNTDNWPAQTRWEKVIK